MFPVFILAKLREIHAYTPSRMTSMVLIAKCHGPAPLGVGTMYAAAQHERQQNLGYGLQNLHSIRKGTTFYFFCKIYQ